MKLLHISDLHLGKRVNEVSLLEDQAHTVSYTHLTLPTIA